jgi:hypothetical protein
MSHPEKPKIYREIIDELVRSCHDGQGQIGARRARDGVWNKNASARSLPDQHEVNLLLKRMTSADREVLARLLAEQVETGVFETLRVLEQFEVKPFLDGYEGSPFNDFIGRLNGWKWPVK